MKNPIPSIKKHLNAISGMNLLRTLTLGLIAIIPQSLNAQIQEGLPKPSDPIDLSDTSDLVIFIILPILVFILFLFWRNAMKKRKEKEENKKE